MRCSRRCKRRGVDAHAFDPQERPLAELRERRLRRAPGSRCTGRAARTAPCRARSSGWASPTPAAACWPRRSPWTSSRPSAWWWARGYAAPRVRGAVERRGSAGRARALGLPLMVKPASQGSSVGITKVKTRRRAARAPAPRRARSIRSCSPSASITGDEYTVGVLQGAGAALDPHRAATEFYDYQAKYFRDDTQYHCPERARAPRPKRELQAAALAAFRRDRLPRLGPRRFHARPHRRQVLFHRDQHHAGHDRPQPGADGGARRPASISRSWCGACSRPASARQRK